MMCRILHRLPRIAHDCRGAMAIETAFVGPILVLLALGSFDISRIVQRQYALQNGIAQAESIALAAGPVADPDELESILQENLSLSEAEVTASKLYRCDADAALVASKLDCDEDAVISTYIKIRLSDTYAPIWTKFGVASPIALQVDRTVQLT